MTSPLGTSRDEPLVASEAEQGEFSRTPVEILMTPGSWISAGLLRHVRGQDEHGIERLARRMLKGTLLPYRWARTSHLRRILGPDDWNADAIRRFEAEHLDYQARIVALAFQLEAWGPAWLRERTVLKGEDHLREALSMGRGLLLINEHMDFWYARFALPAFGYPLHTITSRSPIRSLESKMRQIRRRFGVSSAYASRAKTSVQDAFAENRIVSLTYDVLVTPRRGHGVWIPFGHASLLVDRGSAALAVSSGVPVLRSRVRTVGRHRWIIEIEPAASTITASEAGADATPEYLLGAWLGNLYRDISETPTRWYQWSHARVRSRQD